MAFQFDRECRTATSESYVIDQDDEEIGRVELHYTPAITYGTLCVLESITEDEIRSLISEIDERFVLTNDPFREDFLVTVWNGREHATYSDEDFEDEDGEPDEFGD
ncbi:MAG TPA: hypothetical protein VMR52_13790 [Dehalococcoidia bacterium]|nr:hypothetical protein [Dehalococcoidia bacterium]